MAFAAARMIRDTRDGSKDKARKPSAEYPATGSGKNKVSYLHFLYHFFRQIVLHVE